MTISMAGLLLGPSTVGLLSDAFAGSLGDQSLRYAAAVVPAIFGIPILLLIGYARRAYKRELDNQLSIEEQP